VRRKNVDVIRRVNHFVLTQKQNGSADHPPLRLRAFDLHPPQALARIQEKVLALLPKLGQPEASPIASCRNAVAESSPIRLLLRGLLTLRRRIV